jgi:hypothetical protein
MGIDRIIAFKKINEFLDSFNDDTEFETCVARLVYYAIKSAEAGCWDSYEYLTHRITELRIRE